MGTLEVVGIYAVIPSIESIVNAARYHECDYLLDDAGNYTDEIYWNGFENLALVEIQIQGEFSQRDIDSIKQNDQAPYMEFYLDSTGTQLVSEDEAKQTDNCRVCFFLHFVDTAKPLAVGRDQLELPTRTVLPERLKPYTHYLPVD